METIAAELIEPGDKRDELGRWIVPRERRVELVRAYHASGLTQAAFARREGLKYTTFAQWVQVALKTNPAKSPVRARGSAVAVTAGAPDLGVLVRALRS